MSLMDFIVYVFIYEPRIIPFYCSIFLNTFFKSKHIYLQDGTIYHIMNCSSEKNEKKLTTDKKKYVSRNIYLLRLPSSLLNKIQYFISELQ